ncbi:hypothetical protein Pyrfu_1604 [Pyrolobus fumarii 1A]|uniref:Uncharacterized protein n=1 Tax=Pyrolobus fumarii (strain DSM 11204 / 1A) TaxID=694429 RepID=G0EC91_PYRF1|nr:hypothetical protein [Pyrolobus fumarii]AEM39461.1 hypothetical protein Pyrfu_1604 [Pyrolobus fumarii 1A]
MSRPAGPGGPTSRRGGGPGKRPQPQPLPNGRCNPLCPYFRCMNKALTITRRIVRGRMQRVALCRMVGGPCIGPDCQYAACAMHALLPDGTCAYAKEKGSKSAEEVEKEILEELKKEEEELRRAERIMRKHGFEVDEDML